LSFGLDIGYNTPSILRRQVGTGEIKPVHSVEGDRLGQFRAQGTIPGLEVV
jgi:hypothetical protein